MEFIPVQITEIISEITRGEQGLQGLVKQDLESLMLSERSIHNASSQDVSNGYRDRQVYHGDKVFEPRVPSSRNSNFYPILLGVLKDQEEEAQKLVSSLYCSGLTTEQVGKIYEQFYGKYYSKSQVKSRSWRNSNKSVLPISGISHRKRHSESLKTLFKDGRKVIRHSKDTIMTDSGFILHT